VGRRKGARIVTTADGDAVPAAEDGDGVEEPEVIEPDGEPRSVKAFHMWLGGAGPSDIARVLGYASRSGAAMAAKRHLHRVQVDVEQARALEMARTDTLQAAIWPQALAGNLDAIKEVRGLMAHRLKLVPGLAAPVDVRLTAGVEELDAAWRELEAERAQARGDGA
jgi:hypothetical protein